MATMLGPNLPTEPSTTSPSVMPVHETVVSGTMEDSESYRPQPSPRANPPPNPPFVFPARASPSSAPSSYSRASGRRPKSFADSFHLGVSDTTRSDRRASLSPQLPEFSFNPGARSPNPERPSTGLSPQLPDFKFNPGAGMTPAPLEHPFLSPPQSPHTLQTPPSPRTIPTRPGNHGHRRGGSEFVGGQIRSGDAITVLSTSPTKSESGFASPQLKPANPRRGHAHRRSAAISSHDLSMILKPTNPQPRGSSAPSSPVVNEPVQTFSFPNLAESAPEPKALDLPKTEESSVDAPTEPEPVQEEAKAPVRPVNRARVGFSDTLEFIPRPLSLVSSDTSSTMTARPGHSLSGSISSLISLTSTTSNERTEMYALSPSPSRNSTEPRPSTAGAILERSLSPLPEGPTKSPQRRNSIPLLNIAAANGLVDPDTPSPGKAQKRWSFFGLEPFSGSMSPTQPRRSSASSSDTTTKQSNSSTSSVGLESEPIPDFTTEDDTVGQKSCSRKNGKVKKKKVRSWAGSILTKKSKPRHSKKPSKSRCPPSLENVQSGDVSGEMTNVESEQICQQTTSPDGISAEVDACQPRPDTPPEDEPSFPMIDLDAALGPFNTPLPRNPEWEAAQRASGLTKRPLHSAARLSGFSGPGMNYQHRRAESAPEMPPFNRAGLPRYNSNSTMADVFEEEEEEEGKHDEKAHSADFFSTAPEGSAPDGQTSNINIRVTPDTSCSPSIRASDYDDDAISSRALSRRGSNLSGLSDEERTQPSMCVTSDYSASSLHDEIILEETPEVKWNIKDNNSVMGSQTSDSSTPSPRRVFKGKDLAPVDVSPLHLPAPSLAPVSPYSIGHSSSFPSPRSPMSYEDGNRISTAPSSVTEDNFQSLLMGEPGPEVRISMEIPSLTSSNSTMTRESAFVHQLSHPPVRGERPASFSSPFGRRGSLASIGRLISTSHGERSKLSTEVSLETEQADKKQKNGKSKRFSRLMQFWKPKEGAAAK
ncbi:hypothetical protein MCOR02_005420 [Pyricularia oryzae]|nr:hypothetical protein MCOR02_005420 [Pyricularia oryzae]KAI6255832.1 hypothetical protein MCOR19_007687 [Pyricularia oryzae]KAI6381095.1 hypothetical protein MCOR32_003681 [Pyricularia oryzae]KAI6467942.1 hypothetical protein MCOR15_002356 [Pyricularia oryzae]KAI6476677.1 hypothetical protein MCOR18_006939 [Pyricularia oryzae]